MRKAIQPVFGKRAETAEQPQRKGGRLAAISTLSLMALAFVVQRALVPKKRASANGSGGDAWNLDSSSDAGGDGGGD